MKEPPCSSTLRRCGTAEPTARGDLLFLILVSLLGLVLRLDFLIANNFVIDSDEAIVGLMGKHILEGAPVPTFYYGQHYMGSLEAILAAGVFALVGVSSVALKAVPLAFSIVLIWIQYALGKSFGGRGTARIAALLIAVPPSALVIWSAMARGGFIEVITIGSLALLFTLHGLERGFSSLRIAVIAFLLGLGWWVNNQIIYFIVPIAAVFLVALVRSGEWLRVSAVGAAAFILGSLPFWRYNLQHDFASTGLFRFASPSEVLTHLAGLLGTALPILVGAQRFWAEEGGLTSSTALAGVLYLGLALAGLSCSRARCGSEVRGGGVTRAIAPPVLVLMCLVACSVFVLSSFGALVQAPRYLLPLYVPLFLLVGYGISRVAARSRPAAYGLLCCFLVLHLASSYAGGRALPGEPFVAKGERAAKDHRELLTWLREHQVAFVRTNYWIGYRLAFESGEQTRFLMYQDPHYVRIPAYEAEGRARNQSDIPYVLVPVQADVVRMALRAAGYRFEEQTLSGYQVFSNVRPPFATRPLSDATITTSASASPNSAALALDGDVQTRWGSGQPQAPGMEFVLSLRNPREVCGLQYDLSGWPQDYPRALQIALQDSAGQEHIMLSAEQFAALRYFTDDAHRYAIYFDCQQVKGITLRQLGSDPIFDWSIGELALWTRAADAL